MEITDPGIDGPLEGGRVVGLAIASGAKEFGGGAPGPAAVWFTRQKPSAAAKSQGKDNATMQGSSSPL